MRYLEENPYSATLSITDAERTALRLNLALYIEKLVEPLFYLALVFCLKLIVVLRAYVYEMRLKFSRVIFAPQCTTALKANLSKSSSAEPLAR